MRKLRYGMVGGGPGAFIGDVHRKAISMGGAAELTAGCFSRSMEKTRALGAQLGLAEERCYPDFEAMAEAEAARADGIDFAVIVTPNDAHYAACKAFLQRGVHVSCDKPLCVNVREAEELHALAEQKGLILLVTYTYMGYVMAKQARELVKSGAIGRVRMVMAEYPQSWLAHEDDCGGQQNVWRCDPGRSGETNCLGDIGTHVENAVARITGLSIKRLLCRMDRLVPGRVLDDNDMVMVEYENGATGLYWTSQVALGSDNGLRVRVYGERGSITWAQEEPEKLILADERGEVCEQRRGHGNILPAAARYSRLPSGHPEGVYEAMANLYAGFTRCLQAVQAGEFDPDMVDFPTVKDGLEGIRFVDACLRSARGGNIWVDM